MPRIKKLPLTVPVSPVFSKPRIRHVAGSNASKAVARLTVSRKKTLPERRPANRLGNQNSSIRRPDVASSRTESRLNEADQSVTTAHDNVQRDEPPPPPTTTLHRFATSGNRLAGTQAGHPSTRKLNLGPPQRQDSVPLFNWSKEASTSNEPQAPVRSHGPTALRRPLTLPVPFRFATDEVLRKKIISKPTTYPLPSSTTNGPNAKSYKAAPIKRNFPQLVCLLFILFEEVHEYEFDHIVLLVTLAPYIF